MSILDRILAHKDEEIAAARERVPDAELARAAERCDEPTRGFRAALDRAEPPAVVAELKRRSPSRGWIREDLDPEAGARAYARGGAAALSVLTDEHFFGGHLEFLGRVRKAVGLPLLRKDFVLEERQVDEARVAGADAVLLIVAALDPDRLAALHARARSRGLDVLVEVHDEAELDAALACGADLIGVNHRDLRSFEVDLSLTGRLVRRLDPEARERVLWVAESGIHGPEDIADLQRAGARAFLVGESLMREADLAAALGALRRTM